MHALQEIAAGGMTPVTRAAVAVVGRDASYAGNMLANEVIAYTIGQSRSPWRGYAVRILALTTDARESFMKALKDWLKSARYENAKTMAAMDSAGDLTPNKDEKRLAGKRVNSATTGISELNSIAYGWNHGATDEGLLRYVATVQRLTDAQASALTMESVSYDLILEFARTFTKSKAGRPTKAWRDKLVKWLDENQPDEDNTKDMQLYAGIVKLLG